MKNLIYLLLFYPAIFTAQVVKYNTDCGCGFPIMLLDESATVTTSSGGLELTQPKTNEDLAQLLQNLFKKIPDGKLEAGVIIEDIPQGAGVRTDINKYLLAEYMIHCGNARMELAGINWLETWPVGKYKSSREKVIGKHLSAYGAAVRDYVTGTTTSSAPPGGGGASALSPRLFFYPKYIEFEYKGPADQVVLHAWAAGNTDKYHTGGVACNVVNGRGRVNRSEFRFPPETKLAVSLSVGRETLCWEREVEPWVRP